MSQQNNNSNDIRAQLEAMRRENEALKAKLTASAQAGSVKMTDKGGISVYGLGRFPVTLYPSQWDKLFGMTDKIKDFIKANEVELTRRGEASKAAKEQAKAQPQTGGNVEPFARKVG